MGAEVTITGPLYDGGASKAVSAFLDDASREVAELGVNEIQSRLGQVLEHPTGRYRGQVTTDRASGEANWSITDHGVIYGPWLEGTGSRNKTTRFKGYSVFRKTRQWLEGQAVDIAESKLGRYLGEMGGD